MHKTETHDNMNNTANEKYFKHKIFNCGVQGKSSMILKNANIESVKLAGNINK